MRESYKVAKNGHEVHVDGSLKDESHVTVEHNGNTHEFDGFVSTSPTRRLCEKEDGSYVKETPTRQEIYLSEVGVTVEKSPTTVKLRTDREVEKNVQTLRTDEDVDERANELNAKIKNEGGTLNVRSVIESSSSLTITVDDDENIVNTKVTQTTSVPSGSKDEEPVNLVSKEELVDALVPGFFTTLLLVSGIIGGEAGTVGLGIGIYLFFELPTAARYAAQRMVYSTSQTNTDAETEEEPEELSESEEDSIERIQEEYAKGNIGDVELQERLEEELERQEVELETETN